MTLRLTISRAILIFGLITAAGLGAVIATSVYGLAQLRIGGPLYNQIKLGNDFIADILPPPEYVIEAYLEATLVLHDPAELAVHRDRIAQLEKEYDERREFWVKSDLDPTLKTKLAEKSDSEVRRFWSAIHDGLLPALVKGDSAAAAKAYAEITARYAAHRAIIDDIVKQTNDQNAATEVAAADRVSTLTLLLWSVSGMVFLLIGAGIFGVAFGVIRPMAEMTNVMKGLAGGDLDVSVPALSRGDEVGAMARAVQVFRENALRVRSMESEQTGLQAEGRRRSQGRDAGNGRRLRFRDRKNHPDRIDRLLRTRIIGRTADQDRRSDPDALGDGCRRVGAILGKCAVRRRGGGRDGRIGLGDRPPGPGFAQNIAASRQPGRADQRADC